MGGRKERGGLWLGLGLGLGLGLRLGLSTGKISFSLINDKLSLYELTFD